MYRAYHAIRGLTGPDGRSTNAIYGFVTMLRKLLNDHQPQCIVAAFDLRGPTFRSELAADYKANRAPCRQTWPNRSLSYMKHAKPWVCRCSPTPALRQTM
jgi:5'-3' exonuclease